MILANPGTTLGSGSELQIVSPTSTSSNKTGVYDWTSPSQVGYVKYKVRTTSATNGNLNFSFGVNTLVSDNQGYTSHYNNTVTSFTIAYASGAISSVVRRISGSNSTISGSGLAKDSDQAIEVYASNSAGSEVYNRGGVDYTLNPQSWDLWVDGTKISPALGWARAGSLSSGTNISGFGFFAESSTSNSAVFYIDDLEYSNALPVMSGTNTSVQFVSTSSSAGEASGSTNLALSITDFDAANATSVTISATGATGRVTSFTSPVVFPANSGSNENCVVVIDNNALCDGDQNVTFTITGISGGQGTPFVGANASHVLTITDDDVCPELFVNPGSLDLGSVAVGGNGSSQSFDLSGSGLTGAPGVITVTAPNANFEVSNNNSTWGSSTTIAYGSATLSATPVWVRATPQSLGAQSGDVTLSGGGVGAPPVVALSASGIAPQIYWNFSAPANASPTFNAIANLSSGALGRGNNNGTTDLINSSSASSTYSGASGGNNAGAAVPLGALNPLTTTYFSFTLTPASGYGMAINAINFGSRRTGTGPQSYAIRWSLDGYASNLAEGSTAATNVWAFITNDEFNWTVPVNTPVTFRIYGFDCAPTPSINTANWRIDDLQVLGVALQPAAVWYSRGQGNITEPMWSTTPTGDPGPALFTSNSSMVVQSGDIVSVNANTSVNNLTVEEDAILDIEDERLLSVFGDVVVFDGNTSGLFNGEISLESVNPVSMSTASTVELTDLTVAASGGVTLSGNWNIRGTLILGDGDFDATNANVTLTSDEDRTGRLGPVGPTASYTGNLTVQRFIPGGATNWRLLGSTMDNATVAEWNDDFFTAGFPGSNYPNFIVNGQPWPSIRKYEESNPGSDVNDGLVGVVNTSEALVPGRGYAAWSGDNLGGTAAFTVSVTGEPTIAYSAINLPVSFTDNSLPTVDGWNLVSNPLASPVDFTEITLGADMTEGYYVYDPATGNSAFWDEDSQTSTPEGLLNGVIQSSQGFWLKANGSDASASLDESAKVSGQQGGLFGGSSMATLASLRLRINGANTFSDEARVVFAEGIPAYDSKDALKLDFAHASAPRIATRSTDGLEMIVNRYGELTSEALIPVTVRTGITGNFTITAYTAAMPGLSCILLEDLLTGAITPLHEGATYTFNLPATTEPVTERFVLRVGAPLGFGSTDALCADATGTASVELGALVTDVVWTDGMGLPLSSQVGVSGTANSPALVAGNYSVSVASEAGCGTLSQDFTISAPFALEMDAEHVMATCPNTADGMLSVSAFGGVSPIEYSWSTGSNGTSITVPAGSYQLTITDANGCTTTEEFVITSGDGPEAGFELEEGILLVGENVFFTNTSVLGDEYFWDFGDGNTSSDMEAVHSYALPGLYTVTLTVFGGACEDSFQQDVVVQVSTSVASHTAVGTSVWSTTEHFVIQHGMDKGSLLIEVIDATGRLHMQKQLAASPGQVLLPNSSLSTGVWFVRITNNGEQKSYRVPLVR